MTRSSAVLRNQNSSNAPLSSRVNRLNRSRSFKKSVKDRAPLGAISLNKSRNGRKKQTKTNPFTSFNPNKSGIILATDDGSEPSDFSHFLSPNSSPPATASGANRRNGANPTNLANPGSGGQINGNSTSNASSENANSSGSNVLSPQSRSNKNIVLKEKNPINPSKDDLIFAGLQRFNSMTLPFNPQSTKSHNLSKNQLPPLPKSHGANLSRSNLRRSNAEEKENRVYKLDYLPMDWCLKRSLYFVSDQPLDWCCKIPLKIQNAAMHRVDPGSLHLSSKVERKQYEFYKEMIHYQYPHNRWPLVELGQLHQFYLAHSGELEPLQKAKIKNQGQFGADNATAAIAGNVNAADNGLSADQVLYNSFIDRLCEWMESFHSLYALYRMQFCQYIYLHFDSFFNIVFVFDDDQSPRVIITNTHESFRALLIKHGIVITTPLESEHDQKGDDKENENAMMDEDGMNEEELEEFQRNGINVRINKRKGKGLGMGYNNKQRTATLIEGKGNVHSFYDFFINYVHRLCLSNKKCHDVPLLFSDKIFLNSKCSMLSMSKNHRGLTADKRMMYTMQLNGYILPTVHQRTVQLLCDNKQNVAVTGQLNDRMSGGINYCANSRLFRRLKDEKNYEFKAVRKVEVNATEKKFIVHLQ